MKKDLIFWYKLYGKPYLYKNGNFENPKIAYIKKLLQFVLPEKIRSKIIQILLKKYVGENSNRLAKKLYMSVSEVKKLIKNKMYVGSHGYNHVWLNKLSRLKQEKEINKSLNFLNKIGSKAKNWIMCYPFGGFDENTIRILKKNIAHQL